VSCRFMSQVKLIIMMYVK